MHWWAFERGFVCWVLLIWWLLVHYVPKYVPYRSPMGALQMCVQWVRPESHNERFPLLSNQHCRANSTKTTCFSFLLKLVPLCLAAIRSVSLDQLIAHFPFLPTFWKDFEKLEIRKISVHWKIEKKLKCVSIKNGKFRFWKTRIS